MFFCPACGSKIVDPTNKYCSNCGKPIGTEQLANETVLQPAQNILTPASPYKYNKRNTIILISLLGLPFLFVFFSWVNKTSTKETPAFIPKVDTYQAVETPKRFLESGFFKHIGESRNALVESLGEPTLVKNGMYVYEEYGWRQIYSIKNGKVHDVLYQELNVDPDIVESKIDRLVMEFGNNGFRRIPDYENVKRFRNSNYEISIMPIRTEIGTYNLGLMAFLK